jgi:AcrR family transcriptional regulator
MGRNARIDPRVKRTLDAIDRAFCDLVLEREPSQFSVSLLCRKAGVNKKTFYAHYRGLDDLFKGKLEEITRGFLERIAGYSLPEQLPAIHEEFFRYSASQGRLYERLICSQAYQHLGSEMLRGFVRQAWKSSSWFQELDEGRQSMLLCFLHSTGTMLYRQWVADGKTMPAEEACALSGALLCRGLEGLMAERRIDTSS